VFDIWNEAGFYVQEASGTMESEMLVGYARTSTLEQEAGLEAQMRDLRALGCEKLFSEQTSSVGARKALDAAIEFYREGDALVVTKLDRLARSVTHLGRIIETLEANGISLRILNLGVDTATPTGKLMLNVLGGVAQFEREMILERQREGIAKAKAEGAYKGRKPTARAKAEEIKALAAQGLSMGEIAKRLGIGKGSVHRMIGSPRTKTATAA
jgi:DNA invertase Pin-like site-specific DNA recombinase